MSNKEFPTQEEWAEAVAKLEKAVAETRSKTVTVGEVRDCYEGLPNSLLNLGCGLRNIRRHLSTNHPEALGTLLLPDAQDPKMRSRTLQDTLANLEASVQGVRDIVMSLNALGHNTPTK